MRHLLSVAATLVAMGIVPGIVPGILSSAQAQGLPANKKGFTPITGTVVSIEKDKTGRNWKMTFKNSDDDEEYHVPILPRTQLQVSVKGDEEFLRPGNYVQTTVMANGAGTDYFANDFTVYVGMNLPPFIKPSPNSDDVYDVGGKILKIDSEGMFVQCGPQPRKISFEESKSVQVKIADAALIKEGDSIELVGSLNKAKKQYNAQMLKVESETELTAAEYMAMLELRKKPKSSSKSSKAKASESESQGSDADPFGVLKRKAAKKGEKAAEDNEDDAEMKKEPGDEPTDE